MIGTPSLPGIPCIGKCFAAVQGGIFHIIVLSQIFLLVLTIILDFFSYCGNHRLSECLSQCTFNCWKYLSIAVSFEANFSKCKRHLILEVLNLDFCQLLAIFGFQVLLCSVLETFLSQFLFPNYFQMSTFHLFKQNNSKSSLTNL